MEADASPSDPELRHIFSPPGLELADAVNEMKAAALENMEDKLGQLGDPAKHRAAFEALRRAVLEDVDARVSERAEELWARGKQMLSQIQQKHKESSAKLSEEVTRCCEVQRTLEAENGKLKEVLHGLAARLSALAPPPEPKEALMGSPGATTASSCTPQQSKVSCDAASTGPFTPGSGDTFGSHLLCTPSEAAGAGPECKLPEVPRFPFPAPQSPGAPLSLAEALGTQTPHRTPLSLVNSLTPTPLPEVAPAFMPHSAASNAMFSFTLRKADGADLGLNVSHHEHDKVLRVEGLRPDGAVEAWNRQCAGGACAEKAVLKGDQIISVNSIAYDPVKMLEECRDKQLLRLTVIRSDQAGAPAEAGAPGRCGALRADARAFVPGGGDVAGEPERQASEDDPASAVQNVEGTPERV
mmetsp:Transcript_122498/g.357687  ORF Transcript_122498/g.357687 Transcript_122498/m.357687 type:complete len:413 (-) Transcript_122498:2-1240(-)